MKKILIFSTAYFPLVGGAEIAVKEITNRIEGFDFDLITPRIKRGLLNYEEVGNIKVYRVGFGWEKIDKLIFPVLGFFKALMLSRDIEYSLIWSIMASYAGFAALFFKMKHEEMPFLLTLQEGDDEKDILDRVGVFYFLWRKIFERADFIQVISNYLADFAKRHGAKSEIAVIPNGVDLNLFFKEIDEKEILKLKNDLGIKKDDFVIITASRLVKKNGIEDLIKAVSSYKLQAISYKLLILGVGDLEAKLKRLAQDLKIEGKVQFIGLVDYKNLPKYLKISNLFIRPSLSEGLGNAFLEAMAAGIPIIGTPVGGIPDFLIDKGTGLFCEVQNSDDLAEKISIIYKDPVLVNRLTQNGRNLVLRNYSWNKIASQMFLIFLNLTKNQ